MREDKLFPSIGAAIAAEHVKSRELVIFFCGGYLHNTQVYAVFTFRRCFASHKSSSVSNVSMSRIGATHKSQPENMKIAMRAVESSASISVAFIFSEKLYTRTPQAISTHTTARHLIVQMPRQSNLPVISLNCYPRQQRRRTIAWVAYLGQPFHRL